MAYQKVIPNKRNIVTPVYEQASPNQVLSSDGAFVFQISPQVALERFLVLGSDSNTYYAGSKELTDGVFRNLDAILVADPMMLVNVTTELSVSGRIPKNQTALLALAYALASPNLDCKNAVIEALPKVARQASDLFMFVEYATQFRGWGRKMCEAVDHWYNSLNVDELAYQMIKYQSRKRDANKGKHNIGYTHAALLKLSHVKPANERYNALYRWVRGYKVPEDQLPDICVTYDTIKGIRSERQLVEFVQQYNESHNWSKLTHEFIPSSYKNSPKIWETLLPDMPINALLQSLGKLTAYGVLGSFENQNMVERVLTDPDRLKKGRVHPIVVLKQLVDYNEGRHERGTLNWSPVAKVSGIIESAFYNAFDYTRPIDKKIMVALDVSLSMTWAKIAGLNMTPRVASAVMAMAYMKKEQNIVLVAFSSRDSGHKGGIEYVNGITKHTSLNESQVVVSKMRAGATELALPMLFAEQEKLDIDVFIIFTDNELNRGMMHPFQALKQYRNKTNHPHAAMVVNGMVANEISIADPSDKYSLDIAGFDSAAPNVIREFLNL